ATAQTASNVQQSGAHNTTELDQSAQSAGSASADVRQGGTSGQIFVTQAGTGANTATVEQLAGSSGAQAQLEQLGEGSGRAAITQDGSGAQASISQQSI